MADDQGCCCNGLEVKTKAPPAGRRNPEGIVNYDKATGDWTWAVTYNLEFDWKIDFASSSGASGITIDYELAGVTASYETVKASPGVAAQFKDIPKVKSEVDPNSPYKTPTCRAGKKDVTVKIEVPLDGTLRDQIKAAAALRPPEKVKLVIHGNLKVTASPRCPDVKKPKDTEIAHDLEFTQDLSWGPAAGGRPAGPKV